MFVLRRTRWSLEFNLLLWTEMSNIRWGPHQEFPHSCFVDTCWDSRTGARGKNTLAPRNLHSRLFFSFLRCFLGHRAVSYPSPSLCGHVWKPTFSSRVGLFIHMQIVLEDVLKNTFQSEDFSKTLVRIFSCRHIKQIIWELKTERCMWAVERCYRYHKM